MSFLEPYFDDAFGLSGSKRTFANEATVAQFVDPQYLGYGTTQPGLMTPEPSPTDATPRRSSFAVTENGGTSFSGSSAATSFSACGTPSLSTPSSSASSSRRQSMLLPESQQYYLSPTQSSPLNRPQRPKRAAAIDHCPLEESSHKSYIATTATASLIADNAATGTPGGDFAMVVDDYTGKTQEHWPSYGDPMDATSLCGTVAQLRGAQIDDSTLLGRDYVVDFKTAAQAPRPFEDQRFLSHAQPDFFGSMASQLETEAYDAAGSPSSNPPCLGPPFEYRDVTFAEDQMATGVCSYRTDSLNMQTPNDSSHHMKGSRSTLLRYPTIFPPSDDSLEDDHATSPAVRVRSRRQRQGRGAASPKQWPKAKHRCRNPECDYACNRPEHLRRHELSKHRGPLVQMHPCQFHNCKDRRTGKHREIIARLDNLKAHYNKTHFKYGNSEKGGKNERKSMKAAYEMGLSVYDNVRWALLLDKKMDVNHEIEEYMHVWKMLGYSILETRDTKVKSVVPGFDCPDDATLQKYDPRWRALWDGTLTLDKALSVGENMEESEAQGLLGVTMLETEAMGIDDLDPRWKALFSGRMSVEQSEKLGVKQRNPLWKKLVERRRAR